MQLGKAIGHWLSGRKLILLILKVSMSSKTPKTKPDKAILERLEAEGFIEWPEGPKPALRKPLPSKIGPDDKTTAQIISEGRR